jgi:hypothetical protein
MFDMAYVAVGYALCMFNPAMFMLCMLPLIRLKYYNIYFTTQSLPNKLVKNVRFAYRIIHYQGRNQQNGYFWSWRCVGCVVNTPMDSHIHLICTPSFYNMLMDEDIVKHVEQERPEKESNSLSVHVRRGSYKSFYYHTVRMDVSHLVPKDDQTRVVDAISEFYYEKSKGCVFLYGVSGAGKTTIGYLVAKKLNCAFCRSFNPSDPGDELSILMCDIHTPLVLVIEEADVLINNLHANRITKHREVPMSVYNKPTWNTFLDDICFYPILLILTSNTSMDDINKLDESYLRKGRVDINFRMDTKLDF